jgi:hypothetical protein
VDYTTCGGGHSLDSPCTNAALASSDTPGMHLQAHPNVSLYGSVYQPRGAWLTLQGNGSISSPLVFITGAVSLQGGADLVMLNNRDQLRRSMVALVE